MDEEKTEEEEKVTSQHVTHDITVDMSHNTLSHAAIRSRAHATYVSQAHKMAAQYNTKSSLLTTYNVGQFVSVTVELGDHPNRLPQRNIGGVLRSQPLM